MIRRCLFLSLAGLAALAGAAPPAAFHDAARGAVAIPQTTRPPTLTNAVNDDQLRTRNFDMQPPTIPHRVDGYQVDKNFNKCLDCHARPRTAFSRAIPVSSTHYIDRSGKVLGQISTRRYFCMQCHVAQEPVRPFVGNTFEDIDTVMKNATARSSDKK